jgi:hypothetical protein
MRPDHQNFVDGLHGTRKVLLTFFSKEDGGHLVRTCAPMDFGPSRRAKDGLDRYHFWDYDSDKKPHALSLLPEQVVRIELLEERFDPAEFVTWDLGRSPWFLSRDWGRFG